MFIYLFLIFLDLVYFTVSVFARLCVCALRVCIQRSEEGVGFSGIGFTGGCEPVCILGTEPGSSARVPSAVKTMESSLQIFHIAIYI